MNSSSSINLKNLIESKSLESNSLNLGPLTNSNFNDSFNNNNYENENIINCTISDLSSIDNYKNKYFQLQKKYNILMNNYEELKNFF